MGFLGKIFNDVVDIASAPIKIVTKVTDSIMDSEITDYVDEVKDTIKVEE